MTSSQIVRHPVTLFIAMAVLILIAHFTSLSVFYVQDDAYAWLESANWKSIYATANTALQYRPNAWFLTYLLDQIAPDEPWPLRVMGMFILWLTGVLTYYVVRALSKSNLLAIITSLLVITHPAFYSYMTLYLSAVMTGLGLIFVLAGTLASHKYSQHQRRITYGLTILFLLLALTSYETAIIVLPIMIGIDYLYAHSPKILATVKRYTPHIIITFIYLYIRKTGIDQFALNNETNQYNISLENILYNINYLYDIVLGQYINDSQFLSFFIIFFITLGSILYVHIYKKWRLFIGAISWLILGALPFIIIQSMSLHYGVYSIIGFCLLLAMAVTLVWQKRSFSGIIIFSLLIIINILANHSSYKNNILTSMAYTGQNIVTKFEDLNIENRNVIMMNMSNHLAWRIHFGNSINIAHRDNPYIIEFPQGDWPIKTNDTARVIFVENFTDDTSDLKTKLYDITPYHKPDAPIKTMSFNKWRPDNNKPLTVIAPNNVTLSAHINTITCQTIGDTSALTFPPGVWTKDDYILATPLNASDKPPQLTIQYSMNLPTGSHYQRCSDTIFTDE